MKTYLAKTMVGLVLFALSLVASMPRAEACGGYANYGHYAVRFVVNHHVDALRKGDVAALRKIWMPKAQMVVVRTTVLPSGKELQTRSQRPIKQALVRWSKRPSKASKVTKYKLVKFSKKSATVKVSIRWHKELLNEELKLVKSKTGWKLAKKTIFYRTIAPKKKPKKRTKAPSGYGF